MTRIWCDYFALLLILLTVINNIELVETSGNKLPCPQTMENIYNSSLGACYALVDPIPGPVVYQEAVDKCKQVYFAAVPVIMSTMQYLDDIRRWAISEGLPDNKHHGFWLGFTREKDAPVEEDGSLTEESATIRKDRSLFKFQPRNYPMNDELWRDETQPGEHEDYRDEKCTAQKRPVEFKGVDDFMCDDKHYAVCVYFE